MIPLSMISPGIESSDYVSALFQKVSPSNLWSESLRIEVDQIWHSRVSLHQLLVKFLVFVLKIIFPLW